VIHPIDRSRVIERFESIPRLALGHYPTPLEKATRFRTELGPHAPKLYIKRDDLTGPGCGGNKVRKLEYVLAEAMAAGADTVITCGGVRSNHCRATAMLAAKLGLGCVLVQNQPGKPYPAKPASLAIEEWVGARVVPIYDRLQRGPAMEDIAAELRAAGKNPYIIPLGASTPLGAMGYVSAVSELAAQMDAIELRQFDAIYFSSSSGGTQAGLSAGAELFLRPGTELVGVSPDDPKESIQSTVGSIIGGMEERLGAAFDTAVITLDDFVGEGYGIESEAGREALSLVARTEGILLDPVYTAKAMAGCIAAIRTGRYTAKQNLLFWHTGGQMALYYA
jgi:D-cysteine desulfhydrase family pyridoxal phosphate-dependent enzyme